MKNLFKKHETDSILVNYSPGRSSLVAELSNGEGKVLGFTGHKDVVDAGDESQRTYPPYEGHKKEIKYMAAKQQI